MSEDKPDELDSDTRELLSLHIDDMLFGEANKWVKRIEERDFVTTPYALISFPQTETKSLAEELRGALTKYKEERMRHAGVLHRYRLLEKEWKSHQSEPASTTDEPPSKEAKYWKDLAFHKERMMKIISERNLQGTLDYLVETRTTKILAARTFLAWVDKAITSGGLKEGEGSTRKLKKCNDERLELESDFQELREEYTLLDAEYSRLEWDYNTLYYQFHVRPQ